MAELKTKKNAQSVTTFLNSIEDPKKRADAKAIAKMMREASGSKPSMWGSAIVGYGNWDYQYESGREGKWFLCGFSPRKQALTLYIMPGFGRYDALLSKLGKHKTGKSCLYIKSLDDVDCAVLRKLIDASLRDMNEEYGAT